jgi:hypothetical protein
MAKMRRRPTGITTHAHEALKVVRLLEAGQGCGTRTSHTDTTDPREQIDDGMKSLISKAENNFETPRLPDWKEVVQVTQLLDKRVDCHPNSDVTHILGSLCLVTNHLGLCVELAGNSSSNTSCTIGIVG